MKQEKERKKRNTWYVIGGIAFVAGMFVVMPKLIEKGKVFIAESPLYEITTKDETYFAYNESEKESFIKRYL